MNFGHFWASLPSSPLTFHNVTNPWRQGELSGNEEQKKPKKTTQDKQKENNKERHWRDKQYSPYFGVKTSLAEGRRRFHKNTAHAVLVFRCLGVQVSGVQVFRCSGVQVFRVLVLVA